MRKESCIRLGLGLALVVCALVGAVLEMSAPAAEPSRESLAAEYAKEIRPLFQRYCWRCHSSQKHKGDVVLESFTSLADIRKAPRTWQKVLEMLDTSQMPPSEAKQPNDSERSRLRAWVRSYLRTEARAQAGDPGPVVLRRLSNAQYTYTLRDLTGITELQPARQFPVDGAAGEGFTNTGQALVMSPELLTKYLDAGKEIAGHAVLLPDGLKFLPGTSRRDWTNEILDQIRDIYHRYSDARGGTRVNLQGIVFDTNEGGRLPLDRYLEATLVEREALKAARQTPAAVARQRGLNAKYLGALWTMLNARDGSPLLDVVRRRWQNAKPGDGPALAAEITKWQQVLTKFQNVGHMKSWMVPVNPMTSRQEIRLKMPATDKEFTLYLNATGEIATNYGMVIWNQPRFRIPGQPDLFLRDARFFTNEMLAVRERLFASTARCLAAIAEVSAKQEKFDTAELARRHNVDTETLSAWLDYLGIGKAASPKLDYFTSRISQAANYDFVKGWGKAETPHLVANSSDQHVRIPGNMKPHGVCVHPSPTLQAAVGWKSPIAGAIRIEGKVTPAHPECGMGVTWRLEVRRGTLKRLLAAGTAQGNKSVALGPIDKLTIQKGDLISLLIGPRNGSHACGLTDLELVLTTPDDKSWSLTRDVSGDVLAGNPHADRQGNKEVWHFYVEPVQGSAEQVIPDGSVLGRWLSAELPEEKAKLAEELQELLTHRPLPTTKQADALLYRQLASLAGPLLTKLDKRNHRKHGSQEERQKGEIADSISRPRDPRVPRALSVDPGIDPALFGKQPDGREIDGASLGVKAPSVLEIHLPGDLFAGSEFVTTGLLYPPVGPARELHAQSGVGGVQLQVPTSKPSATAGLRPNLPILIPEGEVARQRWQRAFDDFRALFPAALCYTKIVPVDEVITLTLFHREDEPLCRLMLDDKEKTRLDRLWEELHFVSRDALTSVDAFNQLMEYATQDSDPKLFEPFRKPIHDQAAAFHKALVEAETKHVEAIVAFAARAYRRPLSSDEDQELRELYRKLRQQGLAHEEAIRLTLARVLVAPEFLYRLEKAAPGKQPEVVSDSELASRLSYFLFSSMPDPELLAEAAAGRLRDPEVLAKQTRRMLKDPRVRRLASEFACQWLHIYDFDRLDEKSERLFPTFAALRGDMYEEAIRFFTDLFQSDASVLTLFDADHTFVNEALAKHYGIPGVTGPEWRRVEGVRKYGRGGILGLAATLAKQSGASRSSPILRGNWVSEVLLGEKLPRPPKDVPRLPEDESDTQGLTLRQLVEKHTSNPACAVCHTRIDPFGFALERFDAIGRRRDKDLGERLIDAHARLKDGTEFEDLNGLRQYLLDKRLDDVLQQFCRKLLGYALGRSIQLSDELLLEKMQENLKRNGYRFSSAVETIVRSSAFREIRGRDFQPPDTRYKNSDE
jgi:hypothetical protein